MSKIAKSTIGLFVITVISYAIISQANLKYSAVLLALSQAVICYLLVLGIERSRPRIVLGIVLPIS